MHTRSIVFAALHILTVASICAQSPLRVFCFDATRAQPCGTSTFSFPTSQQFASARGELLLPTNFGPTGTVQRSIQFATGPEITPTALSSADVVLLTALAPAAPLSPCELAVLADFVQHGGGLLGFDNQMSENTRAITGCGSLIACGGVNYGFTGNHPVLAGPFGALAGGMPFVYMCRFSGAGPNGTAILAAGADTVGAAFAIGSGRAVIVDDEEFLMSAGGCPAAPSWSSGNPRGLLLNSMAWVAPPANFQYVPGAIWCPFGDGCAGSGGTPVLTSTTVPSLGSTFDVDVTGLPAGGGAAFMVLGFSDTMWSGMPLPASLDSFGMTGCTGYVSVDGTFLLLHTNGVVHWQTQIPSGASLAGITFFNQALSMDPGAANALGAVVSNAGKAIIG